MQGESYLIFHQGAHAYAIESSSVVRILPAAHIWRLPLTLDTVRGIIMVDEQLAAVIDVEALLFQPAEVQERYIVVLQLQKDYVGIYASFIEGTQLIEDCSWQLSDSEALPYSRENQGRIYYHLELELLWGGEIHDQIE